MAAALALLIATAGVVFVVRTSYTNKQADDAMVKKPSGPIVTSVPNAPPLTAPRTPPSGFKEYRNEFYRFQLFYPEDMRVTLFKEKGSAATIVFDMADQSRSFQVFVKPFGGTEITQTVMLRDEPSGVFDQLGETQIANTRAITFFGKNVSMGDTKEIWFIQQGFLYEVTTYKQLDQWLAQIMTSWVFLVRS